MSTSAKPPPGPAAGIDAASVLRHAALAAQRTDLPAARADQFVFIEAVSNYSSQTQQSDGTVKTEPGQPTLRQSWQSVDGTHDGLVRERPRDQSRGWADQFPLPGCAEGKPTAHATQPGQHTAPPCAPQPAIDPSLPTDPAAMLTWLRADTHLAGVPTPSRSPDTGADPDDQLVFQRAGELLHGEQYLTPQQLPALFDALANLPGATVVPDTTDLAGRHGIGVDMPDSETLIFDAKTYAFLGTAHNAILRESIVDRPGQVP
jgi:hypothetical protein